jgi:hypothetical protein
VVRGQDGGDRSSDRIAAPQRRRTFLRWCLAGPAAVALAASGAGGFGVGARRLLGGLAQAQTMPLTPACGDGGDTVSNTEGPYYKLYTPQRQDLREGVDTGVLLTLSGTVYGEDCRPVPSVLLDFWQADANGAYDLSGYRLRGHARTVAYSGDTGLGDAPVELGRGSDVYVLEAALPEGSDTARHLTPSHAARIGAQAGCKELVLTHFYPETDRGDLRAVAREHWTGPLVLAHDGLRIPL